MNLTKISWVWVKFVAIPVYVWLSILVLKLEYLNSTTYDISVRNDGLCRVICMFLEHIKHDNVSDLPDITLN